MKLIQLIISIFVLGLFLATNTDSLSINRQNDDDLLTTTSEVLHLEKQPVLNDFEDYQNSSSLTLSDEDEFWRQIDEEQYQKEFDHHQRQKRAAPELFGFNGEKDTNSGSRREAFRNAKEQNGIPRSQQPIRQYQVPDKHNPKVNLRTYDFKNSYGKPITIRQDLPTKFKDGGSQGHHFNAGPSGGKLQQHHYYKAQPRG